MKLTLHVYLAFVLDAQRKPHGGVLLASDSVHAMSRAIERCKAKYGPKSRVSKIQHLGEADLQLMNRTQFLQVLSEFDQIAFVAVEVDRLTRQFSKMIQDLAAYAKTLKAKLEN